MSKEVLNDLADRARETTEDLKKRQGGSIMKKAIVAVLLVEEG